MARKQELRVVISGDASQLNRAFGRASAGASSMENRIGRASSSVGRSLANAGKIATAALGVGVVGAVKGSIDAFMEAEQVAKQTNTVLKSTGGVANVTAKEIANLATAISRKSGLDDEALQSSQNLLLTFTKVRNETGKGNDIFNRASQTVADFSVRFKKDLGPSAILVGKALNDPVKGLSALGRVGVQFDDQQKKLIKTMVESGDVLGAQKQILKEIETQTKGAADAYGETLAGKIGKAKTAFGNLGEAIGGRLAPVLTDAAVAATRLVEKLATSDRPAKFFEGVKDRAGDARDAIAGIFSSIGDKRGQGASLGAAIGDTFAEAVGDIDWSKVGDRISAGLGGALKISGNVSGQVAAGIKAALSNVNGRDLLSGLLRVVSEAINALFSPSFWRENFANILATVTIVIPVGKILKVPGFGTLYNLLSKPFFRAVQATTNGMIRLFSRFGGGFLAAIAQSFPRITAAIGVRLNRLGQAVSGGAGRVVAAFGRKIGDLSDRAGSAAGRAIAAGAKALVNGAGRFAKAAGSLVASVVRGLAGLGKDASSAVNRGLITAARRALGWVRNFATAGFRLAKALGDGIVRGIKSIPGRIAGALGGIVGAVGGLKDKITGQGDGIGKQLGGQMGSGALPKGGGGGLKGANSALGGFAAIGSRLGLGVSSGLRPGAITSSGRPSFHGTGEAIDVSGPPAKMLRYFRYLKSRFGSRLAELIYTPGGVGISNGRPHRYTGQVAADHFDHVHVALDLGKPGAGIGDGFGKRPGIGDGLGKFVSTSYGPPWGGINGMGVTANGTNLKGAPRIYGVAADPSVLPMGSRVKIRPNPFGYSGAFRVFDTGGAIKGRRIDFYDWRGRKAQMSWGRKTVTVSTADDKSGGGGGGGGSRRGTTLRPGGPSTSYMAPGVSLTQGGGGDYEQQLAESEADIARGEYRQDTGAQLLGLKRKEVAVRSRLSVVNRALRKKGLRKATRLRLTQERTSLLGELGQVRTSRQELAAPQSDAGGGDDPNQALIDAINAKAEQDRELAEQAAALERERIDSINALKATMDAMINFANQVTAVTSVQAVRALSDTITGELGGRVAARSALPAAALAARY